MGLLGSVFVIPLATLVKAVLQALPSAQSDAIILENKRNPKMENTDIIPFKPTRHHYLNQLNAVVALGGATA